MGSGAAAGIVAAVQAATPNDLNEVIAGLSAENKQKVAKAIYDATKWNWLKMDDQETRRWVQLMMAGGGPMSATDFIKASPYHLPEFTSKIELGQAAPDGKVFELDGSEISLSTKIQLMGHGPGKLMVLNLGSYT